MLGQIGLGAVNNPIQAGSTYGDQSFGRFGHDDSWPFIIRITNLMLRNYFEKKFFFSTCAKDLFFPHWTFFFLISITDICISPSSAKYIHEIYANFVY